MRDYKKWTAEQEAIIREKYPTTKPLALAKEMGVPVERLKGKARHIGVKQAGRFDWTPETEQLLKDRYAVDGPTKLAEQLGTNRTRVIAKARRLGVEMTREDNHIGWTEEMLEAIKERYVNDGGIRLAGEFGLNVDAVRRKASEMGLHTIAGHKDRGERQWANATHCNIHYFDFWSPNMAYILGYLFADGCIVKDLKGFRINLAEKDLCVLEFMRAELGVRMALQSMPAKVCSLSGRLAQPQWSLIVNSKAIVKRLMALGMKPRKTFNDDPFPDVPDDMMPHFIRGCFDGDGSACTYKVNRGWGGCSVSYVGSIKFVTGFRDALVRLAGMSNKPLQMRYGKTVTYCNIAWSGINDLQAFYRFVYPNDHGFCLSRKRNKIRAWLNATERTPRHTWTEQEEALVQELENTVPYEKLAELFGRNVRGIDWKLRRLKSKVT